MSNQELAPETLEGGQLPVLRYAFGRAAHDLNNYLGGLLGYLGLVRGKLGDAAESVRFLDLMERSGKRMGEMLKMMAEFAEPADTPAKTASVTVAIREAASRMVQSLDDALEVKLELGDAIPHVQGSAGSLRAALEHLLVNAVETTEKRPAPVAIRTALAALPASPLVPPSSTVGQFVCVEIEDYGEGMNEETVRRAIVPFYTTKRANDQHGLGLTLVCSYVCGWGGGLDIRSTRGAGTTVRLYLVPASERAAS
jgi:signal transduction histidine kinase